MIYWLRIDIEQIIKTTRDVSKVSAFDAIGQRRFQVGQLEQAIRLMAASIAGRRVERALIEAYLSSKRNPRTKVMQERIAYLEDMLRYMAEEESRRDSEFDDWRRADRMKRPEENAKRNGL